MLRRILGALAALVLLVSSAAFAVPAPAQALSGICDAGGGVVNHIFVKKTIGDPLLVGSYFDYVSGEISLRDLDICTKLLTNPYGGSWIMAANVESFAGEIYQMGYGQNAGASEESIWIEQGPQFYSIGRPIGMSYGDTLKFEIWRASSITVGYRVTNKTTGQVYTTTKSGSWASDMDRAWWGAETHDNSSAMGSCATCARTALRFMGYSTDANGSIIYRSDMTSADVIRNDSNSNHHGHIIDWSYGGDGLEIESH